MSREFRRRSFRRSRRGKRGISFDGEGEGERDFTGLECIEIERAASGKQIGSSFEKIDLFVLDILILSCATLLVLVYRHADTTLK